MSTDKVSVHGSWASRWVFIFAATGSAVGLGSIWKFPYMVGVYGGGAFVLMFLACIALIGIPVMLAETLIGRRARQSPANALKVLALEAGHSAKWSWGAFAGIIVAALIAVPLGYLIGHTGRGREIAVAISGAARALPSFGLILLLVLVIATLNLNGDYVSDALAAQVGGIGIAPGANINYETGRAVFEATHGTAPATRKLPYDAEKDFTPIGMIGSTPNVLCINTSLPPQNFKAFLDYVKQNPGRLSYGSAGAGSLTHLAAELFKLQTNSFMVHIPYRGIAPAITDLIGGQTQLMFPGLAAALPHIRSGRIRALAVTGTKRHPQVKDIPTLEEMGLKGFDAQQWYGVVGPANMPAAIVKTLNDTMLTVLAQPDFKEKLSSEAVELMPMKPAEFAAYMKADLARWTQLAKTRNIQLDG